MKSSGLDVEVVKAEEVMAKGLTEFDLIRVGGPVHAWNATKPVKDFLDKLKSTKNLAGKKAFAFDTKMKTLLGGSAADKIEKN